MTFEELVDRFERTTTTASGVLTRCPAHEDNRESLHMSKGEGGKILIKCHAGCSTAQVVCALGIQMKDLFPDRSRVRSGPLHVVKSYDYQDERGNLLMQVLRCEPKDFRQRAPDGKGGWTWSTKGVRRVIYRLPEVLAACKKRKDVWIVEGEKDSDRLASLGLTATCNAGGAGKWRPEYCKSLSGAGSIVVVGDKDEAGRKHAADVKRQIIESGIRYGSIHSVEAPRGKDVSDHFDAGGTLDELLALVGVEKPVEVEEPATSVAAPSLDTSSSEGANRPTDSVSLSHSSEGESSSERKETVAEALVRLAAEDKAELFHDADGNGYASVLVAGHRETFSCRSKAMRVWLSRLLYVGEKRCASGQALADAIGLLEGQAVHDGPERVVAVRLARHEGAIFVDLGDPSWDVARVDAEGWRIVRAHEAPVRFRRPRGMRPLPRPVDGGDLDGLAELVNVPADQWPLVKGWLVTALRGVGPFFLLTIQGEQGSAKTTLAKMLRHLIDPAAVPLRSPPKEERDLAVGATNALVLAIDNLSGVPAWLSDSLCRVATGGGLATRELYTDSEEVILDTTRPVLLNGIDDLLTRPDLADRALALNLPTIEPSRRRQERDLWRAFHEGHPRFLGALLTAVSAALRLEPETVLDNPPRMADAATWATAAEQALGMEKGAFVEAMTQARDEAVTQGLEADVLAGAIRLWSEDLGGEEWRGPASKLLEEVGKKVTDETRRSKAWPKTATLLSSRLTRLAPSLREVGVEVITKLKDGQGKRSIRVRGTVYGAPAEAAPCAVEAPYRKPSAYNGHGAYGAYGAESRSRSLSGSDWTEEEEVA